MDSTPRAGASGSRHLASDWFARARLKLRHLQLLTALDEVRNLNRAARSLGLTQPAASKLLAEIEQMVGEPVFERRPRGVEPNACGEVLVRRAHTVLAELEQAATELNGLRAGSSGLVGIGAVTMPAVDCITRVAEAARQATPGIQISVEVDTSPPLIDGLRSGRLDFVLARLPSGTHGAELDYREVGAEELCFLVRDGHPLLKSTDLSLAKLSPFPWVLEPRGSLLRQRVEMLFAEARLPPPAQILNTASVLVSLATLSRSDAISAVSASVAAIFGAEGSFRSLPALPGTAPLAVQPFGLIRLRDRALSPAARRLYAMTEEVLFGPDQLLY